MLHDTTHLLNQFMSRNPVNRALYLQTLTQSKWYGPYKDDSGDIFCFFAITNSGNNDYTVALCINVDNLPNQYIYFFYFSRTETLLSPYHEFQI